MSEFRRRLLSKKDSGELKENEILAVYNVTTTEGETRLLGDAFKIAKVEQMFIDDISITPTKTYTFTTIGEHTVKLKIADNAKDIASIFRGCSALIDCDLLKLSSSISSIDSFYYSFAQSGLKYIDKINFRGGCEGAFQDCTLQSIPDVIDLSKISYSYVMFNRTKVLENTNTKLTVIVNGGYTKSLFAGAKIPNVEELELIGDCGTDMGSIVSGANFPKKLICLETDNVTKFNQICWTNTAIRAVHLGSVKKANSFFNMLYVTFQDNNIEEFTCLDWKAADLDAQYCPKLKSECIHYIIQNAMSVADGAKARTLTLHATAFDNWQKSEYFINDFYVAREKNITIAIANLTNLVISEGVTSIPNGLFSGIESLTSVVLPSTITEIGDYAFSGCVNISKIIMKPTIAPTLGENVWGNNESNYVGSNVSEDKFVLIRDEHVGYDTDKWNVLFNECGFIKKEPNFIEYLESQSTKGQYINTNYLVKSTDVIKISFMFVNSIISSQPIFGWRWNGNYSNNHQCYINTLGNNIRITIGASSANSLDIPVELNRKYEIEINPNAQKIIINGIETTVNKEGIDWSAIYSNGNSVYPPYLFTLNNIGTKSGANNVRIYYYIVYDINGNEVQHLMPVLDYINKPCMYDLINVTYHYNQSTGNDFTYQI